MNLQEILKKHAAWVRDEEGAERANLSVADLSWANLHGANLRVAKGVYQFGPMPTSGRICTAAWHESGWMVQAGCFWGTLDELEKAVIKKHNCPVYCANIALLRAWKYEKQ